MFKDKYKFAKEDIVWYAYGILFGGLHILMLVVALVEGKTGAAINAALWLVVIAIISFLFIRLGNMQRYNRIRQQEEFDAWNEKLIATLEARKKGESTDGGNKSGRTASSKTK